MLFWTEHRKSILDIPSLFPLHSESIRSIRTPAGDSGWQERKAALRRRRSTAAAENRDGGGAPGGAARPKQAVRASGSFCGARHARSAGGWQHPSAWRGPRPRRLPALHLRTRVAFRELGFGKTRARRRRENAIAFRPRDSGGGGPLELAKRANRGGGGVGLAALSSLQTKRMTTLKLLRSRA